MIGNAVIPDVGYHFLTMIPVVTVITAYVHPVNMKCRLLNELKFSRTMNEIRFYLEYSNMKISTVSSCCLHFVCAKLFVF